MTFLALIAMAVGAIMTPAMIVLLLAGAPNSSAEPLGGIYRLMALVAAVGLAGFAASIAALARGKAALAILIGIAPALFVGGLFIFLLTIGA